MAFDNTTYLEAKQQCNKTHGSEYNKEPEYTELSQNFPYLPTKANDNSVAVNQRHLITTTLPVKRTIRDIIKTQTKKPKTTSQNVGYHKRAHNELLLAPNRDYPIATKSQ